jgi:hypothetical protein
MAFWFFFGVFTNSQIWLNQFMDDHHFGLHHNFYKKKHTEHSSKCLPPSEYPVNHSKPHPVNHLYKWVSVKEVANAKLLQYKVLKAPGRVMHMHG